MAKSKKLILDIDENEIDIYKKEYINLLDLQDEIEKLFEEGAKIDKRKKRVYQEWKDKINFLIHMYNTKSKYKAYKKV